VNIVVFGPHQRTGVLDGERIIDLNAIDPVLPSTLLTLIELGATGKGRIAAAIERTRGAAPDGKTVFASSGIKLHAPWTGKRVACAGGNYAEHSYGMAVNRGTADVTLEKMHAQMRAAGNWGFWKVLDAAAGPGDEVPYPSRATDFDYEGEVAIVIGKRGKNIPAAELHDYVWGVTVANDWSNRDFSGPQRAMSFNLAKNFDRSLSLGPSIAIDDVDPQNIDLETRVNGALRQRYNSRDMVFSFAEILAFLSVDFTFVPGDVILGGTGAGTAQDSTKLDADGTRPHDLFLKTGDTVEISSPAVGKLTNRIV
jgi:2-keto-4-pentenoate hydratase/2-oxohepta-3-ene-1,7-dioic acid hydratase in catechol pathway